MATSVNNPTNSPPVKNQPLPFIRSASGKATLKADRPKDAFNSGKDYQDEGAPLPTRDPETGVIKYTPYASVFNPYVTPPTKEEMEALARPDETSQTQISYVKESVVMDVDARLIVSSMSQMRRGVFREAHYPTLVDYIKSPHYKKLREAKVVSNQLAKLATKTKFRETGKATVAGVKLNPRLVHLYNKVDKGIYRRLKESGFEGELKKLREDFFSQDDLGNSAGTGQISPNWDGGQSFNLAGREPDFTPLIAGPYNKQLYWFDYLDMHAKAFQAWCHNPVAKRIVKVIAQFVLGKGVKLTVMRAMSRAEEAQQNQQIPNAQKMVSLAQNISRGQVQTPQDWKASCQSILDRHWMKNTLHIRSKKILRSLIIFGEQFIRYFDAPWGLKVRQLDPSTIWEVITDPDDPEQEFYIHMQYPCLHGGIEIPLLNGKKKTVEELAQEWKATKRSQWIYTYDRERRTLVPGKVWNVIKVGDKKCVEVTLDNKKSFTVSEDHPVLLRDGEYKEAAKLSAGESLMPFDMRLRTIQGHKSKNRKKLYQQVYQPELDCWEFTHRRVAKEIWGVEQGEVVHHDDRNKRNNEPENLKPISSYEHLLEHSKTVGLRKIRERNRTISKAITEWHKEHREEFKRKKAGPFYKRTKESNRKISEARKREWANPRQRNKRIKASNMEAATKASQKLSKKYGYDWRTKGNPPPWKNHRVVSVRKVGWHIVYDLTVDILHQPLRTRNGKEVHNPIGIVAGGFLGNTRYQWY